MRILTPKQMKAAENAAFRKYFTEAELMKAAGDSCADIIIKKYAARLENNRVAVVCGNGKNAGDGFVIAKRLGEIGAVSEIVLADRAPELEEPLLYYNEAVQCGIKTYSAAEYDFGCAVIIDCLFGTGFHGEVKAPFQGVIEKINASGALVIAIDVPSGTNAETGEADLAVKADLTIAVSDYKFCHVLPPSNAFCGKTVVAHIGIPDDCYDACSVNTITKQYVKSLFKKRDKNCHKGSNGRQLNICGSYLMPGAAVISAEAALKTGVGLLECAFPKSIYPVMTSHLIQPIFSPLCENENKTVSIGALSEIYEKLAAADAVLIGCGLGNNDDTQVVVNEIVKAAHIPLVIDADGINSLKVNIDVLKDSDAEIILTPHPAEMGRLIGESAQYVQQNRIDCARAFAREYGVVVVLKGANTVITDGERVLVNLKGNPGLAMAGTGDMLAGMAASFAAQGIPAFDAAAAAVYIHSLCGDITAAEISTRGMTVEDMLELLGALMSEFE